MHGAGFAAFLAVNLTTPKEPAVAHLHDVVLGGRVASATAEQVAAVRTHRRFITLPSASAQRTSVRVALAKVRRVFVVDEVVLGWCSEHLVDRAECSLALAVAVVVQLEFDLGRAIELLLEQVTDLVEHRQAFPTRSHGARL